MLFMKLIQKYEKDEPNLALKSKILLPQIRLKMQGRESVQTFSYL